MSIIEDDKRNTMSIIEEDSKAKMTNITSDKNLQNTSLPIYQLMNKSLPIMFITYDANLYPTTLAKLSKS